MSNNSLVFIENDTPLTTSRTVAEQFGKQHKHVIRDIKTIIEQMEDGPKIGLMFHETTYADKYGRQKPMYTMTRDGFSLLTMGFTGKKALQFKLKFIDAFNRMEQKLAELAAQPKINRDDRWLQTRQFTKLSHRPFTAGMKIGIEYLRSLGETRPDSYFYGHWTNIVQNACGIIKGQRDSSDVHALNRCDQCQNMIGALFLNLVASAKPKSLAEFDAAIILQLNRFNNLLNGQLLIA